ncbi:ROK family protein [Agromyces sp. ISL-38]|uniref:ROK family transcriptional regulator n=1 Tax=Agromyces sp. ISL-38 TaxID=2819107 RepID=UPI001BE5CCD4|nr:ROK family transcriptional regulator [Agromyces sp. ISL-38]MBT2498598.1 ROK family protein [Agromyces sp. ISL-38]
MAKKASVKDVRRTNRALILRHLLLNGPTSRSEIGAATGLSAATVTSVVNGLLAEGVVKGDGFLESDGGRPRAILAIDPDGAWVIGADISESLVRVELFDLTLSSLAAREYPFEDRHLETSRVREILRDATRELLDEVGGDRFRMLGLGLGVPGIVEGPTGDSDDAIIHADVIGWHSVDLAGLTDDLGFPVYIDNGAKTTTQAESWLGSARGLAHSIVVLIGEGVGAGIVTDGRLYRGSSSSAGEWGHTKISFDGPSCRCGSRGCVETFVGASAVLARWNGTDIWNGREADGIEALFTARRAGDDAAAHAVQTLIDQLGLSLANLVNLYNPQKIIVGGWFGDRIATDLLDELRAATRAYALEQPGNEVVLARSKLGQDAVALGAATLAIDRFVETGWPN